MNLTHLIAVLLVGIVSLPARADEGEARRVFNDGVVRLQNGDFTAARRLFERADELVDQPVIFYNLGLTYEALGEPVLAVRMMTRVVENPGKLTPEFLDQARKTIQAMQERVGLVTIRSEPAGAEVRANGELLGRTPLERVEVPIGTQHLEFTLEGFGIVRRTELLGKAQPIDINVALEAAAKKHAHVLVRSRLPAADILIDGIVVARTPLSTNLAVEPGTHRIEVRRPGYLSVGETMVLAEGATGEVSLDPTPDGRAAPELLSTFLIRVKPEGVTTWVDGTRLDLSSTGSSLPSGPHVIRLEHSRYESFEMHIDLPAGQTVSREVALSPTSELKVEWIDDASSARVGGGVAIAIGGALVVAGSAILIVNAGGKEELERELDASDNYEGVYASCENPTDEEAQQCVDMRTDLFARENVSQGLDIGGAIGVGLGAAAVVAGIVVLATTTGVSGSDEAPPTPWARLFPTLRITEDVVALGLQGQFQ